MDSRKQAAQTAKAAVAESGVGLGVQDIVEVGVAFGDSAPRFFYELEVVESVTERAPDEEFHGEVIETFRGCRGVAALGIEHAIDEQIANGERKRPK